MNPSLSIGYTVWRLFRHGYILMRCNNLFTLGTLLVHVLEVFSLHSHKHHAMKTIAKETTTANLSTRAIFRKRTEILEVLLDEIICVQYTTSFRNTIFCEVFAEGSLPERHTLV